MYDCGATSSDRNVVVLNDIHIDIMDYIVPASCNETEFRQMWAEFEWENKVAVNTPLTDLHEYLASLLKVRKWIKLALEIFNRQFIKGTILKRRPHREGEAGTQKDEVREVA